MKFSKFAAVLALATLSTFAYSQNNDKVYTIRFSHVQSQTALKGIGAEKFKELAEKYGNGRIKVEVYHDGKLVNDRLSAAALIKNNVDMVRHRRLKWSSFMDQMARVVYIESVRPGE